MHRHVLQELLQHIKTAFPSRDFACFLKAKKPSAGAKWRNGRTKGSPISPLSIYLATGHQIYDDSREIR